MKYEKQKDGTYLHNCYVWRREDDSTTIFDNVGSRDDVIIARLNGYAIVPIEEYARLVEMASPSDARLKPVIFSMEDIKEADEQLHNQKGD